MDIEEKFLERAAECARMVEIARDPESKGEWRRMADRWRSYAERYGSAVYHDRPRRPRRFHGWEKHSSGDEAD
jgi:hypothetical protein